MGEGDSFELGVPVDAPLAEVPLLLLILRLMTGLVVPPGNFKPTRMISNLLLVRQQNAQNPCGYGSIFWVGPKVEHTVMVTSELLAKRRRTVACYNHFPHEVAKELRTIKQGHHSLDDLPPADQRLYMPKLCFVAEREHQECLHGVETNDTASNAETGTHSAAVRSHREPSSRR